MTAIKQASVMSGEHLQNLKRYFDWDREKVLDHDTQHIIDEDRWFEEMDATRDGGRGDNRPGKQGAKVHVHAASGDRLQPGRVLLQRRADDALALHGVREGLHRQALSQPGDRDCAA